MQWRYIKKRVFYLCLQVKRNVRAAKPLNSIMGLNQAKCVLMDNVDTHKLTLEPVLQGLISPVMFRLVSCLGSRLQGPWPTPMSLPLIPWKRSVHRWVCVFSSNHLWRTSAGFFTVFDYYYKLPQQWVVSIGPCYRGLWQAGTPAQGVVACQWLE